MKYVLLAIPLAILLAGCDRKQEPLVSHGKSVSHWLQELAKANPKARKKAVSALGHVGTADAAVIPALIDAVKDRDAAVRNEAVLALLNIGPDAEAAIPVLTQAQSDKDATVRAHATKAIQRIQAGK
jgi:HEAT repeat protein